MTQFSARSSRTSPNASPRPATRSRRDARRARRSCPASPWRRCRSRLPRCRRDAFGQANVPTSVIGVLDFALALEIFENEFYKAVLGISSSAAQNAAFATVRAKVPAAAVAVDPADSEARGRARRVPVQPAGRHEHFQPHRRQLRLHRRARRRERTVRRGNDRSQLPAPHGAGRRRHRRTRVQGPGAGAHGDRRHGDARVRAAHPFGGGASRVEDPPAAPAEWRDDREVQRHDHRRVGRARRTSPIRRPPP